MTGDHKRLAFHSARSKALTLACYPHALGQTIYWLKVQITSADSLLAKSTVYTVDYDLMHCQFGHPSKDVLRQASDNVKNFPNGILFPKETPIC